MHYCAKFPRLVCHGSHVDEDWPLTPSPISSMLSYLSSISGVMGHYKTMHPQTNFLGPLVVKIIVPETQCPCSNTSLSLCITYMYCIMHYYRDVSIQRHYVSRTINLGTRGPRKFVRGHIVPERLVTSPRPSPHVALLPFRFTYSAIPALSTMPLCPVCEENFTLPPSLACSTSLLSHALSAMPPSKGFQ